MTTATPQPGPERHWRKPATIPPPPPVRYRPLMPSRGTPWPTHKAKARDKSRTHRKTSQ